MTAEEPVAPRMLLSMVALNTSSLPLPQAMVASFKTIPDLAVDIGSLTATGGNLVFGLGKDQAAVALMPAPIPWSNLEGPCATAWWWPEAAERMRGHSAHVLVVLAGDTGNLIRRHIALTHLTAAVASHTDAAGIYWGGGTLVHDPKVFIEQAQNLSPHNLPLPLWIDFRIESNEDGSYRLFTTGMKAFGKAEIEIPHSRNKPAEVFNFACSIADYVITGNPNIEDNHTVGRSETEKIQAVYAPSMWDSTITVLRLDF
ncbi:MAG: DUF4261 domain-containing protein [Thermoguttaceae bacterium]